MPTSDTIGRTVRTSRPSMREPVSRMFQRTTLAWTSLKAVLTASGSKRASLSVGSSWARTLSLARSIAA
jgi:hypothetical protein